MSIKYLNARKGEFPGYSYKGAVANGKNGDSIVTPPLLAPQKYPTLTVIPGTGTAKMQYTTSPDSEVEAGSAVWLDWEAGEKTANYSDVLVASVNAVRCVSVSGAVEFEIAI